MRITDIQYRLSNAALKKTFKTALREVTHVESIYVFIFADDKIGLGEAVPTLAITGDTVGGIIAALDVIKKRLVGATLDRTLLDTVQSAMVGNTSAKAALDMALYDLLAQQQQQPLYQYLGADYREFTTSYTVSLNDVEEMTDDAERYVKDGFNHLKVKLGGDINDDIQRIKAIRSVVEDTRLSVDANQGWDVEETLQFLGATHHEHISVLEQPIHRKDINGLKVIHEHIDIPLMADESLFDVWDGRLLLDCVDRFNIKLMKSGGIHQALAIAELGKPCMVGSMMESHVSLTAAMHTALAIQAVAVDFDAALMLKEKIIEGGITYQGSRVSLSPGYGLGINNERLWEALKNEKSL